MQTRSLNYRTSRLIFLVAVCGTCVLASATLAAGAGAMLPPPGTPDLSQMVLGPFEFASGGRVVKQGYALDLSELGVIGYERDLAGGRTVGGARLAGAFSNAVMFPSAGLARVSTGLAEGLIYLPEFRQATARRVRNSVRTHPRVRSGDVRLGPLRSLHVGDEAAYVAASVRAPRVRASADFLFLRVDRVVVTAELIGDPGARVGSGEIETISARVAGRIRLGLSPVNSTAPMIFGAPTAGQSLVANSGMWSNDPTRFGYQWERCDASTATCGPILGASGASYTLTPADVAATIRVSVTATNAVGTSMPVSSTSTAAVQ